MPASSPTLVIGGGSSASMTIGGSSLGCIVGDISLGKRRDIRDYQTLCDELDGLAQGTPGQLTIEGAATVEFLVGGAGIEAADNAIDNATLVTTAITFNGQSSGTDASTFSAYVTEVTKSVSPGAATGQVRVAWRAVAVGAVAV
jgi:hypothetical protein